MFCVFAWKKKGAMKQLRLSKGSIVNDFSVHMLTFANLPYAFRERLLRQLVENCEVLHFAFTYELSTWQAVSHCVSIALKFCAGNLLTIRVMFEGDC